MSPNPEMVARAAENRPRNPIKGLDFTESLMLEANIQNKIIIRMFTTEKVDKFTFLFLKRMRIHFRK